MRKEIIAHASEPEDSSRSVWFDVASQARVRLTSEDANYPIEGALQDRSDRGWRAVQAGAQTIWVAFDVPRAIREIHLRFEIPERRTQEFVLLASSDGGRSYQEIVRQQFNFSLGTAAQDEHYFPQLSGVSDLKLTIVPDISGGDARATLRTLRVR